MFFIFIVNNYLQQYYNHRLLEYTYITVGNQCILFLLEKISTSFMFLLPISLIGKHLNIK